MIDQERRTGYESQGVLRDDMEAGMIQPGLFQRVQPTIFVLQYRLEKIRSQNTRDIRRCPGTTQPTRLTPFQFGRIQGFDVTADPGKIDDRWIDGSWNVG
jgi:hypothetical protein